MERTGTTPASLPPAAVEPLPDDPATLQCLVRELLASLQERDRDNAALRHQLDLLLRRLYGPRGERFDPQQPLLFAEPDAGPDTAVAASTEPAAAAKPKRRCRPHGRRRLPENLPRESRHHELPEAARICSGCGQVRIDIGVDQSEQLEYRPASLFVIAHFVHKYVCPCCRPLPAEGPGQHGPPRQETEPLPTPEPQPAPPAVASPLAPAATDTKPAQGSPPLESLGQSPRPEPPTSPCQVLDPSTGVIAAPKPAMPIAKGLPGPGLLAHLIVSKYVDHLPLHRRERVYERQGLLLPRSTLCDWLAASAHLLRPLYNLMRTVVLQSRALHTDDTTVKMQDPVTHRLSTARLWTYLGDAAHPYNGFDFTVNRKRDGPQQFLANYQGYLHADAFSGYDGLYLPEPRTATARITEVACNAHARRKFYEARGSDALRSHQALAYYGQLYELERRAKDLDFSDTQRLQMRQDLAVPILVKFHQWLEAQRRDVLPKSPLAEALGYALHNWTALVRYTEAGYLAIDNNVAEREMKRIAIGRKNWLFVGSPQGGQTAAVLISFTSTCHRLGVEPWAYLQDVLARLPTTSAGQLGDLLPDHWQAARAASATTKAAAASPGPASARSGEATP
jgi:transposase